MKSSTPRWRGRPRVCGQTCDTPQHFQRSATLCDSLQHSATLCNTLYVTKRTGGTTKHQRQHHAQCCNGHQTHSMQHGAQPVLWIHLSHDISRPLFIDTNSTLLLPTFQTPLHIDFGLLRRTSSYFRDLTLIVTRVTLTSIRHL